MREVDLFHQKKQSYSKKINKMVAQNILFFVKRGYHQPLHTLQQV